MVGRALCAPRASRVDRRPEPAGAVDDCYSCAAHGRRPTRRRERRWCVPTHWRVGALPSARRATRRGSPRRRRVRGPSGEVRFGHLDVADPDSCRARWPTPWRRTDTSTCWSTTPAARLPDHDRRDRRGVGLRHRAQPGWRVLLQPGRDPAPARGPRRHGQHRQRRLGGRRDGRGVLRGVHRGQARRGRADQGAGDRVPARPLRVNCVCPAAWTPRRCTPSRRRTAWTGT